jgi:hypothetical protein
VLSMVKYGKYQVILCKFQFSWGNNKKVWKSLQKLYFPYHLEKG